MKTKKGKSEILQLRLTEQEKKGFLDAADIAGIPLSVWARERLRLAAIRELETAGKHVPFISPMPLTGPNE